MRSARLPPPGRCFRADPERRLIRGPAGSGSATMTLSGQEGLMANVFMVLAADHAEVRAMLAELERGPDQPTGADQDRVLRRTRAPAAACRRAARS